MPNTNTPLVSIIMATYNRPDVLKYAIKSVIWQTYKNWELLVVGDACSESTGQVIKDFNNPKISYHNFEENFGEQSGPNNWGINNAKGKYISFLNHDDLWFPDHLSLCISHIKEWGADLVYAIGAIISADGSVLIHCINKNEKFEPFITVPASLWFFKKEMCDEIGLWTSFRQTFNTPSQDWLWRAWKKNKKMFMIPRITAVLIQSGDKKDCYKNQDFEENKSYFNSITNDVLSREKILLKALLKGEKDKTSIDIYQSFRKLLRAIFYRIFITINIAPLSVLNYIRYKKHGGLINYLRKHRGLDPK